MMKMLGGGNIYLLLVGVQTAAAIISVWTPQKAEKHLPQNLVYIDSIQHGVLNDCILLFLNSIYICIYMFVYISICVYIISLLCM